MKLVLSCTATVLVGLMIAACGSDDSVTVSPSPFPTGRQPTRPPSTSSSTSSGFDPGDPDDSCPADLPLTESDLDAEIGWKPGAPAQGSCTAADIDKLKANFSDTSLRTYFDLAKGVSTTCAACVVSKDTDPKWGPIVGIAQDDGETGFVNLGACFGAIEGDACGKAIQYQTFCEGFACNECAFTKQAEAECVTKASAASGMCEPFSNRRTTACPSWTLNVKSCGDILKAIQTLCGTPS